MYKKISIGTLFALAMGLVFAAGCSDANATESVYLPLYEPCPFDDPVDLSLFGQFHIDDEAVENGVDEYDELYVDEEDHVDADEDVYDWELTPFAGETPSSTTASAPASGGHVRVDINRATPDQLTELPGIGPALARRIVEYRRDRQFTDVTQLQRIQGIGPATFERLEPFVYVE